MADLAAERLAVGTARLAYEAALRDLRTAEAHADFWRDENGNFQVVDESLNREIFAEIQGLQPALDTASAAADSARAAYDAAVEAYRAAARQAPLFVSNNTDPVLLLPVRVEAIYFDNEGSPELRIRVYPDDVHVDGHEPALTEGERVAGMAYWRAMRAAGDDAAQRHAAWQALVGASGGARAAWIREALTPLDPPPGELRFPDVELRPGAWTRAAHTELLPDHFEFSAYREGALVWRKQGEPIPDRLAVGIAPQIAGREADTPAFDDESRWLVEFELAEKRGMALVVPLDDPNERLDLLTVVGVGAQDAATGAERVNGMLAAHAYSRGLTPLPVRTPTNNTPGSRSGWRPREAPTDPDVVAERRSAYDPDSDQEAARLARSLGIDGTTVLASVCDPAGGDEALLRRMQALQAAYYAWSPAFWPARHLEVTAPIAEPWYRALAEHYARFVRARGPLPPLRIGRQPYGLLPVSSTDLWQAGDVDERLTLFVRSFLARFVEGVGTTLQVGEGGDQDAVLLDLLSREASPRYVRSDETFEFPVNVTDRKPPPSTVGAIPATSALAWLHDDWRGPDASEADFSSSWGVAPFPDVVPEAVQQIAIEHPLAQILVLFDENLKQMRERRVAPDPVAFMAAFGPLADRLGQLLAAPTVSLFYRQAESIYRGLGTMLQQGPALPDEIARDAERATARRNLLAMFVPFENDAGADLPAFERLFRETLEPLSHRIDAWVTSLATARLAGLRKERPSGIRTGAYGWLMDVEPGDPNPSREGYVVTPSLQHATTAAVLRSGWQAHSDRRALAVDVQSARVRRALAMVEGVREGQTVGALLGYQFERALHDAHLDRYIEHFRKAYPLAPLVEPDATDSGAAQVAIGARNVVDGQALRRDRQRLDGDAALRVAAGSDPGEDAPALRRMLGELDETFDAVSDLLLAESVHHLVGGNPLRAGLAADAAGRGQDLPREFDVLRTPRGGIGIAHHVGILLPDSLPRGWADERPLAKLEPRLEAWVRHRLGPAPHWKLGAPLADLGWCALDLLVAPAEAVRGALAAGELDEAVLARLMLVCERLRATLASAAPLTPTHLDPANPAPISGYDLDELHSRVAAWTEAVRSASADLEAARTAEAARPVLQRLGALGLPVGLATAGDLDRVRALLAGVDLSGPAAPPEAAEHPREAEAWLAGVLATTGRLLHPAIKIAPKLVRDLPPAPRPAVDEDAVAEWLRDMTLVRPRVETLDGAAVAAEVVAGTPAAAYVVAQPIVGDEGTRPWIATAPPAKGPRPRCSLVMQRDGAGGDLCGLVVDSWTEVVPRASGRHGPEEVVGVAFDYDRPGARAPQALLIAVPPDPERGWCMEDLHACLDEALLLSRIRTLDLHDLPELRTVLPIPDGR